MEIKEEIKEIVQDWATGEVIAHESGSVFHIVVPRHMIKYMEGIRNKEILRIKLRKIGEVAEPRRPRSRENFMKRKDVPKTEEAQPVDENILSDAEREFIEVYQVGVNPIEVLRAEKEFGKERVEFLLKDLNVNG